MKHLLYLLTPANRYAKKENQTFPPDSQFAGTCFGFAPGVNRSGFMASFGIAQAWRKHSQL
jgi:hypothetical protein